jgi:hypothetical protein
MDWPKIDSRYLKEAFKEPINFWGMAGFLVGAVFFQDVTPLLLGLGSEALYLTMRPSARRSSRVSIRANVKPSSTFVG